MNDQNGGMYYTIYTTIPFSWLYRWRHFESFKGDDKVKVTVVAKANGEDGNFEAFKQKLEERAKSLKAKQEKHEAAVS